MIRNSMIRQSAGVFCTVLGLAATLQAQPPGFGRPSPDQIFGMLDGNQDGTIDQDELARSRFPLKQRLEDMGIDTSKGVKKEHVAKMFEARESEERERGGERGGDEGRGRGDYGRGDSGRGDYGRGDYGRGDYGRGDYGRGDSGRGDYGRGDDSRRGDERKDEKRDSKSGGSSPQIKVRVDLPEAYKAGDIDQDGQIALYEWLQWKGRALREEFRRLDENGDGFLSPREIVYPVAMATPTPGTTVAAAPASPGGSSSSRSSRGESGRSSGNPSPPSTTAAPSSDGPLDESNPKVQRARYVFGLMDANHDGTMTADEWEKSKTVRPKFESAKIDISKPMNGDAFARNYLVAYAND